MPGVCVPLSKVVNQTRLHTFLKIEMFTIFSTDRSFCHVTCDFLKNLAVIMNGKNTLQQTDAVY